MAQNSLDQDTITKLLASELRITKADTFFEDEELTLIAEAVDKHLTHITLRGIAFKITYKEKFPDSVFVSPIKGFVPCGRFDKENLQLYLKGD